TAPQQAAIKASSAPSVYSATVPAHWPSSACIALIASPVCTCTRPSSSLTAYTRQCSPSAPVVPKPGAKSGLSGLDGARCEATTRSGPSRRQTWNCILANFCSLAAGWSGGRRRRPEASIPAMSRGSDSSTCSATSRSMGSPRRLCWREIFRYSQPSQASHPSRRMAASALNSLSFSEWLCMSSDAVADPVHGGDEVLAELAPELVHVHRDRVALDRALATVDQRLQGLARDHAAAALQQRQQGAVLAGAKAHVGAVAGDGARGRVEVDPAPGQLRRHPALGAADQGAQAGQQLVALERLDQVIVGPGIQAADPVAQPVARGDDQHRGGVVALAQGAQHVQAGTAR